MLCCIDWQIVTELRSVILFRVSILAFFFWGGLHISEDYSTTFLRHIGNYLTFDTVRRNIPEDLPAVRT
jgi:hypothetical protein